MWAAAQVVLSGILGPAWLAKLIGAAAVLLAVTSAYLVWHHHVYMKGWNAHALAVAEQDARTVAENSRLMDIVTDCKRRGLRYVQSTGQCGGR